MKNLQNSNKKVISEYDTLRMYQQLLRDGNVSDQSIQQIVDTLSLLSQTNGNISKQSEMLLEKIIREQKVL
jgi:hypothetical protein